MARNLRHSFDVAHTLTQTQGLASQPTSEFSLRKLYVGLGKKALALLISYEVATYCLATVQAVGLTLPSMVHGGPAAGKVQCLKNMQTILTAAEKWKAVNPGYHVHRPQMSDLKPFLADLPHCPDGGTYEMVYPGHTLKVQDGTTTVVPEDRVAVRCVHEHEVDSYHGGQLSNPFSN